MVLNTRECFFFGTEERMRMFATPLKGSDSSPSGWGADGTLLSGGGYGIHSFGSHKRYTYEWPQSSSPEVAQIMKSYRDGTYGRGLLYFLEPGIYETNILPASWADPSMAINNEAPSLVYGVDPIGIPTSGGESLGLPVISAQYDLSNITPQSVPTPDSSVFLPIPPGFTLFLGAFYEASGSAGVFATPVNSNGTLGEPIRLTEKSNSDTTVVTDRISGDIKGVRLWIGRTADTDSIITVAAICGRLLETSDTVVFGPWTEQIRNRYIPAGIGLGTISAGNSSILINTSLYSGGYAPVTPGEVLSLTQLGVPGIRFQYGFTDVLPAAGVTVTGAVNAGNTTTSVSNITVPAGAAYIVLYLSNANNQTFGFITTAGPNEFSRVFNGDTPSPSDTQRYRWVGTPGWSQSVYETRVASGSPAKENQLKAGPWIGGQGHSGCRFLGAPSYVNNGYTYGAGWRAGFAASFVEVGTWVYG